MYSTVVPKVDGIAPLGTMERFGGIEAKGGGRGRQGVIVLAIPRLVVFPLTKTFSDWRSRE